VKTLDKWVESGARILARTTSRRSFLSRLGSAIVGAASIPLLPVARADETTAGDEDDTQDPNKCNYWRNCAIDGFLCGCCGGCHTTCPHGTEMAPMTWIGTCHNPADNRDYIIAYNDCCGKSTCNRCGCNRNEGDMPNYLPHKSNDTNWCLGTGNGHNVYHCTTTLLLGLAIQQDTPHGLAAPK